jgi:hypothetical protein
VLTSQVRPEIVEEERSTKELDVPGGVKEAENGKN